MIALSKSFRSTLVRRAGRDSNTTWTELVMENLVIESSTHIKHAQWVPGGEVRIAIGEGAELRWYRYVGMPRSVFDGLRAQEMGARGMAGRYPKGEKPFSVGTYYHANIAGRYGEVRVDGPL